MGPAALVIGANLPDIDVLSHFGGPLADLEWRRGWTHGVLALVILPVLLAGVLLLVARIRFGSGRSAPPAVKPRQLLLLSSVAVLSHPLLDTLNTYGMRWLMPFSGRWFYGDVLFIVDPWLWLILGGGMVWSWVRRKRQEGRVIAPVGWALSLALGYIAAMAISSLAARTLIARQIGQRYGGAMLSIMAGPLPITRVSRSYVVEQEHHYRVGTFHWLPRPHFTQGASYPRRNPAVHPAYASANSIPAFRRFMWWARFPTLSVEQSGPGEYLVHAVDLRYARVSDSGFGTLTVPVKLPTMGARR